MTNGQRESSDHRHESSSAAHRDRLWMMMGGSLNPNSTMAEEMDNVLKNEIQAHSVYDTSMQTNYHQVPLPGGKRAVRNLNLKMRIDLLNEMERKYLLPHFYVS